MRVLLILGVCLFATFSGGASYAASLGLTTGTPALYDLNPQVDYIDIESPQRGYFDFLDTIPRTISGNPSQGDWEFDVSMFFYWPSPIGPSLYSSIEITGYEALTGESQFYTGNTGVWGFKGNVLEFHFTNLIQNDTNITEPELFGSSILVTVEMNFSLGSDPYQAFYDYRDTRDFFGKVNVNSIVELPTPGTIPLPAGLPMLLAGLGILAALRRRSRI